MTRPCCREGATYAARRSALRRTGFIEKVRGLFVKGVLQSCTCNLWRTAGCAPSKALKMSSRSLSPPERTAARAALTRTFEAILHGESLTCQLYWSSATKCMQTAGRKSMINIIIGTIYGKSEEENNQPALLPGCRQLYTRRSSWSNGFVVPRPNRPVQTLKKGCGLFAKGYQRLY